MNRGTFFILCLEGALLSFNVAAAAALVPAIAADFGAGQFIAGRLVWFYMLPYGAAALVYGPLVRVYPARRIELAFFGLFSLANIGAACAGSLRILFVSRFLMGAFGASVVPLVLILISRYYPAQGRGGRVGIFFGATFAASLLGLFLSGLLPWRLIFLIPGICGLLLLIPMWFWLPDFKPEAGAQGAGYLKALSDKTVLKFFLYVFLVSLCYHAIQQWLAVYFSLRLYLGQFAISMLITLTSLSGIFGEVAGGIFSDRIGRLYTISLGAILMVCAVLGVIFRLPVPALALAMLVWGLGWTFNHAGLSSMLTDLPKKFVNEAASLNSSVRFISGGLGVALAGMLMERSFVLGFGIFGLTLAISTLVFWHLKSS